MSRTTLNLTESVYDYLLSVSLREAEVLRELREETASHPQANMQISPEQGQFMQMLARLIGAENILEIGVFTGYSSLAVALVLPENGRILACDIRDRKSTRLNSSHKPISYAVFCLKKKTQDALPVQLILHTIV